MLVKKIVRPMTWSSGPPQDIYMSTQQSYKDIKTMLEKFEIKGNINNLRIKISKFFLLLFNIELGRLVLWWA